MKRYIRAMSTSQKDLKSNLQSMSVELTEHLIKLYLFPDTQYVEHWRKEVWAFLHVVPKLKHTNKLPTAEFIFDNISIYLDQVDSIMYMIMSEYSELVPERTDPAELERSLTDYLNKISKRLSECSSVTSIEVEEMLKEVKL